MHLLAEVAGADLPDDTALVDPQVTLRPPGPEGQHAQQRCLANEGVLLRVPASGPAAVRSLLTGDVQPVAHDRLGLRTVSVRGLFLAVGEVQQAESMDQGELREPVPGGL